MGQAWVDVTNIGIRTGGRGATYYFLTLACGHFKSVYAKRWRGALTERTMNRIKRGGFMAPKRVKCLICER